jgi:hypothetical protein
MVTDKGQQIITAVIHTQQIPINKITELAA